MDNVFLIVIGLFVLTILSSFSILLAIIYYGVNAMKYGDDTNEQVTPLLGVVHPNKKG